MVKKIIALVLVLGVLGGIIGCGSGGEEGPATPAEKAGGAPTTG
jgi:hypothetical protein